MIENCNKVQIMNMFVIKAKMNRISLAETRSCDL